MEVVPPQQLIQWRSVTNFLSCVRLIGDVFCLADSKARNRLRLICLDRQVALYSGTRRAADSVVLVDENGT